MSKEGRRRHEARLPYDEQGENGYAIEIDYDGDIKSENSFIGKAMLDTVKQRHGNFFWGDNGDEPWDGRLWIVAPNGERVEFTREDYLKLIGKSRQSR